MSQVDVQWPSEDEDFDATTDTSAVKSTTKAKPKITKVVEKAPEPPVEEEQPAPEGAAEPTVAAAEVEPPASETAAAEPAEAQEAPAEEITPAEAQPDPSPVVQNEAANLAANVDSQPPAAQTPKAKRSMMPNWNKNVLRLVGEAVLVAAVVALGYWAWTLNSDRNNLQSQVDALNANPQSAVQKQTQQLITRVGRLMTLPANETPTVAEVSNAAQAKQQSSFFNNAQNGDRVLMYVKAGEAILYRPSTNKIILVAPLVFTNNGSGTTSSSSTNNSTSNTSSTTSTSHH